MSDLIRTSVENGVALVVLNDPAKRNALSQPMAAELNAALEALRQAGEEPYVIGHIARGEEKIALC